MSTEKFELLSALPRKVLALGLLAMLALIFVFWLVLPSFRWAAGAIDELADKRFELRRAAQSAAVDVKSQLQSVESVGRDLHSRLLIGRTENDAAAAFQSMLSQLLAAQGLTVETLTARASIAEGPVQRLSLDWRGTASESSLVRALAALETGRPLMRVERLTVQRRRGIAPPGGGASNDSLLWVDMRLVAYWAAVTEPASAKPKAVK